MRRRASACVVLVAGLLASPADARVASSCAAGGSETLRENSVARVYEDRDEFVAVCSKRTGHREDLDSGDWPIWQIRLRGHYVAYAFDFCIDALGDEDCFRGVARVDARSGAYSNLGGGRGEVRRVVLRRTGAVAWSEHEGEVGAVYRRGRDGFRRLERAHGLDAASLRLAGTTLSWRTGGERRRATLR